MSLVQQYRRLKKAFLSVNSAVHNQNNGTNKSLRLDSIVTSKKHGYPVCRLQVVGQNISNVFTAREILLDRNLKSELTYDDLEKIVRLDEQIKLHVDMQRIKIQSFKPSLTSPYELTVTLNQVGTDKIKRVSSENLKNSNDLLNRFLGSEAFDLGYTLGQKHSEKASDDFEEAKRLRTKQRKFKLKSVQL